MPMFQIWIFIECNEKTKPLWILFVGLYSYLEMKGCICLQYSKMLQVRASYLHLVLHKLYASIIRIITSLNFPPYNSCSSHSIAKESKNLSLYLMN
jgi:hypothetical protein